MCLVYKISATSNPSAEVFEQFAVTDFARTIIHDQQDLCDRSCNQSTIFPRCQHL